MMKSLLQLILLFSTSTVLAQSPDAILGIWKPSEGNGHVEIYKNGGKFQGRIVWLKIPNDEKTGKPKTDVNHSNEANHQRPILGLVNLWGFEHTGKNAYENGRIYDPKNGKEYKCVMTLVDQDHLDVRGFIGISLIGRTDKWTRVK